MIAARGGEDTVPLTLTSTLTLSLTPTLSLSLTPTLTLPYPGENTEFLVRASYLEIYNEDVRDLLSKQTTNKLELKETPESGVYVKDLTSYVVKTVG